MKERFGLHPAMNEHVRRSPRVIFEAIRYRVGNALSGGEVELNRHRALASSEQRKLEDLKYNEKGGMLLSDIRIVMGWEDHLVETEYGLDLSAHHPLRIQEQERNRARVDKFLEEE